MHGEHSVLVTSIKAHLTDRHRSRALVQCRTRYIRAPLYLHTMCNVWPGKPRLRTCHAGSRCPEVSDDPSKMKQLLLQNDMRQKLTETLPATFESDTCRLSSPSSPPTTTTTSPPSRATTTKARAPQFSFLAVRRGTLHHRRQGKAIHLMKHKHPHFNADNLFKGSSLQELMIDGKLFPSEQTPFSVGERKARKSWTAPVSRVDQGLRHARA